MFNTTSITAVNRSRFSHRFLKPLYATYNFSNIPQTIQHLLTGQGSRTLPADVLKGLSNRYQAVVLLFVDAFGWRFFERYAQRIAALRTIAQDGVCSKLTTQFPSTTAAHATCIHTGLNVGQSGVYEWQYYEPLVDQIIMPLLFSYAGARERDSMKPGLTRPPTDFYPSQTFYQQLKDLGVSSYIYQRDNYTPSTYSNVVFRGANVIPYHAVSEAFQHLGTKLKTPQSEPTYYILYYDRIDSTCHHYGPNTPQMDEAVDHFFYYLEMFLRSVRGKAGQTLLLITADHGQVEVASDTTLYLNLAFPNIKQAIATNRQGKLLVPAGSARDFFLYLKPESLDETVEFLRKQLEGRAEVYRTQELIDLGFFGLEPPSQTFLERVGNAVILSYQNRSVWWYEKDRFEMRFRGNHGGLTPEEVEIPFLALPL